MKRPKEDEWGPMLGWAEDPFAAAGLRVPPAAEVPEVTASAEESVAPFWRPWVGRTWPPADLDGYCYRLAEDGGLVLMSRNLFEDVGVAWEFSTSEGRHVGHPGDPAPFPLVAFGKAGPLRWEE